MKPTLLVKKIQIELLKQIRIVYTKKQRPYYREISVEYDKDWKAVLICAKAPRMVYSKEGFRAYQKQVKVQLCFHVNYCASHLGSIHSLVSTAIDKKAGIKK